jgi:hypothetical protein
VFSEECNITSGGRGGLKLLLMGSSKLSVFADLTNGLHGLENSSQWGRERGRERARETDRKRNGVTLSGNRNKKA